MFAETAKGTPRSPTVSGMSEPDGNSSVDDLDHIEPVITAQGVADEVVARLRAGHQDPEDIRAGAHARWPDHTEVIDDAISAGLDGHTVAVADPGALGQDVVVDPSIDGTTLATLEQSADD